MSETLTQLNQSIEETLKRLNSSQINVQNKESIDLLRKSLALLYNNRGFICYKLVEFNLAADDYTKAINFDPELATAYYNRGTIHYRMNNFDKAFDDMKVAVALDPNNPEFGLAFEQTCEQLNKI